MTLPANLNVYISAGLFVIGAYIMALYVGLIVWTFRDIRARSRDVLAYILAPLLVALFTLPGLLIYMLLRPHDELAEQYERSLTEEAILQSLEERRVCPGCQRRVEADFVVCPYCHQQLHLRCVGCGRLLDPNWDVCPYCGLYRDQQADAEQEEETPDESDDDAAQENVREPFIWEQEYLSETAREQVEPDQELEPAEPVELTFADEAALLSEPSDDKEESDLAEEPEEEEE